MFSIAYLENEDTMDTQNITSQVHMLIDFYMASYYNIDRGLFMVG